MALKLVLIRHGEARGKRIGETDFERELTKAGIEALTEAFPRHLSLIDVDEDTELWSSTAIRARQTADIANETLKIDRRVELDGLYEQDQQAFLEALAETDANTVVAVGPIPFMEDVCARLTGAFLDVSTGAAACVEISDAQRDALGRGTARGRLAWFVQGPDA